MCPRVPPACAVGLVLIKERPATWKKPSWPLNPSATTLGSYCQPWSVSMGNTYHCRVPRFPCLLGAVILRNGMPKALPRTGATSGPFSFHTLRVWVPFP